jgi:hypothetical protein
MRHPSIQATAALLFLVFLSAEAAAASGSLAGIVFDERWSPVAQAEIRVYPVGSDDEVVRVQTSQMGDFWIEGLQAGWFDLEVRKPGFVPVRVPGVEVGPDSLENFPLALDRGKRLEGRAIEPHGAPVEGAEVWVVPSALASSRVWKVFQEAGPAAVTDRDGRFVLQGLDPRKPLHLDLCRPGHHTGRAFVEISEAGPIQIELPRAARLSGRVVDPRGKPVSGATVDASLSGASRGDDSPPSSPCPQSGRFVSAESDTEGRFTLEPLDEGLFEISAHKGGGQTDLQLVAVKAGRDRSGLTFVLASSKETAPAAAATPTAQEHTPAPGAGRPIVLSGHIVGIAPEDLPDVEVAAFQPGREIQAGFVDWHGIYRFLSLSPGEWEVAATLGNRAAEAKIVIAPGAEKPVLDLVFPAELIR